MLLITIKRTKKISLKKLSNLKQLISQYTVLGLRRKKDIIKAANPIVNIIQIRGLDQSLKQAKKGVIIKIGSRCKKCP